MHHATILKMRRLYSEASNQDVRALIEILLADAAEREADQIKADDYLDEIEDDAGRYGSD